MKFTRAVKVVPMLLAFVLGSGWTPAVAKPTPVPGGANQRAGVTGTLSQVLFNGTIRLKKMSLKDAVEADNVRPMKPGDRALVFRVVVSNGTKHEDHGYFDAQLADADGVTIEGRVSDDGWSLQQGQAAKTMYSFSVPHDFVPTKLVLMEAAHVKDRAFRITIRPTDLPPAPAAAP